MWRKIKKVLHEKEHFVLTTHIHPDGDGVGAACALIELLHEMGKNVRFICDSKIPDKFHFLDYHHLFEEYGIATKLEDTEVLILLDTHRPERIGRLASLLDDPKIVSICIDHHEPADLSTTYAAIDSHACSVGAMIFSLYKDCGSHLHLRAATGIYASICCDTGRFSYSSTNRKAHKIADTCIKLGVDPDQMYSRLFQHVPVAQIRVFARALQHMELHHEGKVVVQQILKEDYEDREEGAIDIENIDLEYIHEFNKWIEDVTCVVLLHELPNNQVRISLRAKTHLDILPIAKKLGGGGHPQAAGALSTSSLPTVKDEILHDLSAIL